jgi:hypothetical protein
MIRADDRPRRRSGHRHHHPPHHERIGEPVLEGAPAGPGSQLAYGSPVSGTGGFLNSVSTCFQQALLRELTHHVEDGPKISVASDTETTRKATSTTPSKALRITGSAGHHHSYWSVGPALSPAEVEQANRRLAQGLGADAGAVCGPAAILRPPGSFNRKRSPPVPVRLLSFEPERCYPLAALLGRLPTLEASQTECSTTRAAERPADPLLAISARVYIPALSGRAVSPAGKARCPFHDDQTPSLHAYREPERGWCCFGCKTAGGKPRGGDIYTFASLLFGIPASGAGFLRLRGRLDERFGVRR